MKEWGANERKESWYEVDRREKRARFRVHGDLLAENEKVKRRQIIVILCDPSRPVRGKKNNNTNKYKITD